MKLSSNPIIASLRDALGSGYLIPAFKGWAKVRPTLRVDLRLFGQSRFEVMDRFQIRVHPRQILSVADCWRWWGVGDGEPVAFAIVGAEHAHYLVEVERPRAAPAED